MIRRGAITGAMLAFFAAGSLLADAATYRVDDSASVPGESSVTMRWRNAATRGSVGEMVDGATRVMLRLNTAPWQNRTGRIYMVLPPQPVGGLVVDWTTQGRLLPGRLTPGERTLVLAGPITVPFVEDTLTVRVQADGRTYATPQRLKFHFEIDVD